jgi:hypothetical protein
MITQKLSSGWIVMLPFHWFIIIDDKVDVIDWLGYNIDVII